MTSELAQGRLAHRRPCRHQHAPAGLGDVCADHGARLVRRRSVLLPDRPDLRADDRLGAVAAVRRAAPLAGRPAAGRRRADRLGVHLRHRRHHQLFLVALRAADRGRQHGAVPARRPDGRDAQRHPLRRARAGAVPDRRRASVDYPLARQRVARPAAAVGRAVHGGAQRVRVLRRRRSSAARWPTACGRRARSSSRRRPRSPTCRRSTSTSSTACRAAWRPPIRSSAF